MSYPWYDSNWLRAYQQAKAIVAHVAPDRLNEFVERMAGLRTRMDFREQFLAKVFDDAAMAEARHAVAALRPTDLELHEARTFGRFVVHDLPLFAELHARAVPIVADIVGEQVESTYNFLALYGAKGVCEVHMDSPKSKWTLDLCLNQSAPWAIHFSEVREWPESELETAVWDGHDDWAARIKQSAKPFREYSLEPGQALVFSGSSQWHYRDPMPRTGGRDYCDLLFFHFCPAGDRPLARPRDWAGMFGIPELSAVEHC